MNRATANKLLAYLHARRDEMVRVLSQCALLESPSSDPSSQDAVFELFAALLGDLGFRCKRLAGVKTGGQLLAIPRDRSKHAPRQLLLGHGDTVWPHDTLAKMPVESRDGRLHGPGVYDMKGGLVQAVFALKALHDLGIQPAVAPLFFINSDEEIGSFEIGGTDPSVGADCRPSAGDGAVLRTPWLAENLA